eukprot:TRINITY_DN3386_c0_g1_i1.p1 TRINITY_DN3386_c0_g1~~TRINITY_DN3386_c0_g1_i1.p1  ORF type:complete len:466 (+),score=68.93 TRINITY_DN3386_c0_g1_i1:190-1398(+)
MGEEIRRFTITPDQLNWETLQTKIGEVFGITTFSVQYLDDEEDAITISSTGELNEAVSLSGSLPRFIIVPTNSFISPAASISSKSMYPQESSKGFAYNATPQASMQTTTMQYEYQSFQQPRNAHAFGHNHHHNGGWDQRQHYPRHYAQHHHGYGHPNQHSPRDEKQFYRMQKKQQKQSYRMHKKELREQQKMQKRSEKALMKSQKMQCKKVDFAQELAHLESIGYQEHAFNLFLLKKHKNCPDRLQRSIDLLEKNNILRAMGYTDARCNLRMLIKFSGNADLVRENLARKQEKWSHQKELRDKLALLESHGYYAKGLNRMLLIKLNGDVPLALDYLSKTVTLEAYGYSKLGLNLRMLLKFNGNVEAVVNFFKTHDKSAIKTEKRLFKQEARSLKKQYIARQY